MYVANGFAIFSRVTLLPNISCDEILPPKHLIHHHLEVMRFVIVDGHPDAAILGKQIAQQLQTRIHHRQPLAVFEIVVVMFERAFGVVRRIDKNTFHATGIERQQRL